MDDYTSLRISSPDISTIFLEQINAGETEDSATDFQTLLTSMLSSISLPGTSQSGFSLGNMLAPLMLSLLEQFMSRQVYDETTPGVFPSSLPPIGEPIEGTLTQTYHSGHHGLDIAAPTGTPVQTTMTGKVIYAGWNDIGYGNLVIIENGPYQTYYGHLSEIPVEVGQTVAGGSIIGLSGNTGNSTGPHLHYEVRFNGQTVDPSDNTLPESIRQA